MADVLYPTRGKSVFRLDYEPEISEAASRVYNDWMIEFCQEAPDRLWGQALLPLWNIENAIIEMERCRNAGLVGVTTWLVPPEELRFSSDHYERFWAAAEDMETPVSMHINNGFGPYAEAAESVRTRNVGDPLSELELHRHRPQEDRRRHPDRHHLLRRARTASAVQRQLFLPVDDNYSCRFTSCALRCCATLVR